MSKLLIMVAPNGARRTKADHPKLPLSPVEIGTTAKACMKAGAGALHLHVRDAKFGHTLDARAYREAIAELNRVCPEMVIQTTTESAGIFDLETQIAAVDALRPTCVSFSLVELWRNGQARAEAFLQWAQELKIALQFILYDADQIVEFNRLWRAGVLHQPDMPRIILVAGRYSQTQDADVSDLMTLLEALVLTSLDRDAIWMTCAFGRGEMACLEQTIKFGGHARVGFENAIVDHAGLPARDNAERVALVVQLAGKYDREIATPKEAAELLGRSQSISLL